MRPQLTRYRWAYALVGSPEAKSRAISRGRSESQTSQEANVFGQNLATPSSLAFTLLGTGLLASAGLALSAATRGDHDVAIDRQQPEAREHLEAQHNEARGRRSRQRSAELCGRRRCESSVGLTLTPPGASGRNQFVKKK